MHDLGATPEPTPEPIGVETAQLRAEVGARLFGAAFQAVRVGRYVLHAKLGSGGMGVVYSAYDEDLERRIAIKLVHSSLETTDPQASLRLRREAQALGRLAHPNVIAVHEVGEHVDSAGAAAVFIAMELVDGATARQWCGERPRSVAETLAVLIQAGRGLSAVHEAGLVHRDIKPDNVMIGSDGRVRIMDFGLARTELDRSGGVELTDADATGITAPAITRSGAVLGTPAYMAAEQFAGAVAAPATDQFAYCVTAWEMLYGERPFGGATIHALADAVGAGLVREPPRGRRVSAKIRRALERGLAVDPSRRWPTVAQLVHELADDPARRRRAVFGVVLAGALVGLAAWPSASLDNCADRDAQLGAVWGSEQRESVGAALRATGGSYGEQAASRAVADLDRYADAWMSTKLEICARGTDALAAAAELCLADRKRALASLVEVLGAADAAITEKAVRAVASLPEVERCADASYLAAEVKPPPEPVRAAEVEQLREALASAAALHRADAFDAGNAIASDVVERARALGYQPLLAQALLLRGRLEVGLRRDEAAEATLREAYAIAIAAGDDESATDVATLLVYVVGESLGRKEAALEWAMHASALVQRRGLGSENEATLLTYLAMVHEDRGDLDTASDEYLRALEIRARVSGPEHLDTGMLHAHLASHFRRRGELDRAKQHAERSLAIIRAVLGPGHPAVADALETLANLQVIRHEHELALATYGEALAIIEAAVGRDHPEVSGPLSGLGQVYRARGEFELAQASFARALAVKEAALGAEHPGLDSALANLGNLEAERGQHELALVHLRRAAALEERSAGPDSPELAMTLGSVGLVYSALGRYDDALTQLSRSLAIKRKAFGDEHVSTAFARTGIGNVYNKQGDYRRALAEHEQALAIWEQAHGAEHPHVATALHNLGVARLGLGDANGAVAALERARALRTKLSIAIEDLADTELALAQACWAAGDRERARSLARQARTSFRASGIRAEQLAALQAWLLAVDPRLAAEQ